MRKRSHVTKHTMRHQKALHILRRARERHGLYLPDRAIEDIAAKVQKQHAEHVATKSGTKSEWIVEYAGRLLRVIYSKTYGMPVTILPSR